MAMKTKEIRDLIEFISKTGLNEVNIETDELKISVKRVADVTTRVIETPIVQPATIAQPASHDSAGSVNSSPTLAPDKQGVESMAADSNETQESGKYLEVKSPMIGTFYRTPNPDSDPFVQVGDSISIGQTVCIIEAMKLFNEIESEVTGTIVKVLVENSDPVEYGQPLFLVDPS